MWYRTKDRHRVRKEDDKEDDQVVKRGGEW